MVCSARAERHAETAAKKFLLLCGLAVAALANSLLAQDSNPAPAGDAVLQPGVTLFTDRDYTLTEAPGFLLGRSFLRTGIEGCEVECVKPGEVFVLTLHKPHAANQSAALLAQGFAKIETPEFQLFPGEINRVFAWRKSLNPGDVLRFKKLALLVPAEGTGIALVKPKAESPEETAARIREMEKVADLALIPPKLNTSPLPAVRLRPSSTTA